MKLTIDRSRWLRGEGSDASYLLRPEDGKMCCLGFLGKACGLRDDQLALVRVPRHVPLQLGEGNLYPDWTTDLDHGEHGSAQGKIYDLNDGTRFSAEERESGLTAIFARNGIELEFVDGGQGCI